VSANGDDAPVHRIEVIRNSSVWIDESTDAVERDDWPDPGT